MEDTIKAHHATRAKFDRLNATLMAEYPAVELRAVEGEEIDHEIYTHLLAGFELVAVETDEVVAEFDKVPELADVLEACAAAEIDPVGADDEEEEEGARGNIVGQKYRDLYHEVSSTGQCNGDWLAERLAADALGADGKLDVDAFITILEANGVDMNAKWATARHARTRGWQGRFRMSGRIVLEKAVLLAGVYFDGTGAKVTPHAEWTEAMKDKHGVWLVKQLKLQSVEG